MATKHSKVRHRPRHSGGRKRKVRGQGSESWTLEQLASAPVGPDVATPSLEEVLAAVEALPPDLNWEGVADHVVPVLPRVRRHLSQAPDPLQIIVPPGVGIGFGIDMGAAFVAITRDIMERWTLSEADLLARALGNLKERVAKLSPRDVVRQTVDDVPVMVLQSGAGCGSSLILLPEELRRLFGPEPKLLLAPMRDLLIALPIEADRFLAVELFDLFASQDPNCLAPRAYFLSGGRLMIDEPAPHMTTASRASSAIH